MPSCFWLLVQLSHFKLSQVLRGVGKRGEVGRREVSRREKLWG